MTILVTGGAGFLGAAIVDALAARGEQVVAADMRFAGKPDAPNVTQAVLDITDRAAVEALFALHKPSKVVHCAAIVIGVLPGSEGIADIVRVNIEGTVHLYDAMVRFGATRAVHISSEEIYGSFEGPVATEDHPLRPATPYAITKSSVEQIGRYYSATRGLDILNVRTSWVYGPGLPRLRIPKNLVEAALSGEPLHLSNGAETAIDHTYIDDFVTGTLLLLDADRLEYDTFHIASGTAITVAGIVDILKREVPMARLSVGAGPMLGADGVPLPRKGVLDNSRAKEAVGYVPQFPPERGLIAYLQALKDIGKD